MAIVTAEEPPAAGTTPRCSKCMDTGVTWSGWTCETGNHPSRCDCLTARALARSERWWLRMEIGVGIAIAAGSAILLAIFR